MSRKVGWSAGLAKGRAGDEKRKKGEKTAFEVSLFGYQKKISC
jgi:hypothetical protein